ncbi:MAG: NAD(P)-dependent oxidoreductase [Methanomicrobiales archaeon HGW-Methanomicrobiales-1]|jgi:dTDP-4-dehydrorhamnose reductase|nr:MAG: NAD(P)-dependent oxidoreductase [Methanomicrobiales archaeon HGW-Methanomicrobiales-1]
MKILILGATGMLGHKLMQVLSHEHTVAGTVRGNASIFVDHPVFRRMDIIGNIKADNFESVRTAIDRTNPEVIINCIGIVKQLPAAHDPLQSIAINALFPHQLAQICRQKNIRLIHMSTDCVFSGQRGYYSEEDPSEAEDLYGKTKYLGETDYPGCLTIRTSMIGRELDTTHGLIEWFMSNEGKTVPGYKNVIFSGLTTMALSEIINTIISDYPDLNGVRQIASKSISKYDLLCLVKETYAMTISIEPDETIINDRSLNPEKFRKETNIKIPSWEYMIDQMHRDPTPYAAIREQHAQQ